MLILETPETNPLYVDTYLANKADSNSDLHHMDKILGYTS